MKGKWKIGLVGVGRGSGYGAIFASDPRCQVVACCDLSSEALGRFQKELQLADGQCFTDYQRLLAVEMDAIFLGTPIPAHAEQTVQALEAGVNVLSEVTAANTIEGCGRIVDAARRTGKTYMMAENCVYWPFVRQWKQWVGAGRLGEIFYSECEYVHDIAELVVEPATGRPLWRAQRPPLHYCSHSLGPVLEITGDRITRAMGLGQGHRILPQAPVGGIDIQVALFETRNGAIVKLLRSSVAPRHPSIHYYMLQGTAGFVESGRGGDRPGMLFARGEMQAGTLIDCPLVDPSLPAEARQGGHGTAEYSLIQDFLRCLETGARPSLDEVRAMDLTVPGLVAHESALQGGRWMDVPSFE